MLLAWLLIIAAFALFTVTSVVGRVWCGYTCPQTIWTAIFMWIEQLTEGPRHVRIRLDRRRGALEKVRRRGAKHALWLGWAFADRPHLRRLLHADPRTRRRRRSRCNSTRGRLLWMVFFTLATYINAGWLREQVCIYMCPYARFQSAMFDNDTLIVSYDAARGEPRGSRKRVPRAPKNSAIASTANCACRSVRPASTSATACNTSASAARTASTRATT